MAPSAVAMARTSATLAFSAKARAGWLTVPPLVQVPLPVEPSRVNEARPGHRHGEGAVGGGVAVDAADGDLRAGLQAVRRGGRDGDRRRRRRRR